MGKILRFPRSPLTPADHQRVRDIEQWIAAGFSPEASQIWVELTTQVIQLTARIARLERRLNRNAERPRGRRDK